MASAIFPQLVQEHEGLGKGTGTTLSYAGMSQASVLVAWGTSL
jgi:hypothetical protein